MRVWDLAAGREEAVLTGHDSEVFSVAITPDGTRAFSGGADATVGSGTWPLGQRLLAGVWIIP